MLLNNETPSQIGQNTTQNARDDTPPTQTSINSVPDLLYAYE